MPFIPTFTQTVIPSNIRAFAPLVKHSNTTNTTLFIDNTFRLGVLNTGASPSVSYDNTNKYFDLFSGNTTTYLLSAMTNLRPTPTPTPTPSQPPVLPYNLDLTGDMYNINLRQIYQQRSGDTSNTPVAAFFRVMPGAIIGSNSTSQYSVTVGQWPTGSVVWFWVRAGAYVVGRGGDAPVGYYGDCNINCKWNVNGFQGGNCLNIDCGSGIFTLFINGLMGSGGGGGGAIMHGFARLNLCCRSAMTGGGGGAGFPAGKGSTGNCCRGIAIIPGAPGSDGTLTQGGAGGNAAQYNYRNCNGGDGGSLGSYGKNAGINQTTCLGWDCLSLGTGGAPGIAINGYSKLVGYYYFPEDGPPGSFYGPTQG